MNLRFKYNFEGQSPNIFIISKFELKKFFLQTSKILNLNY